MENNIEIKGTTDREDAAFARVERERVARKKKKKKIRIILTIVISAAVLLLAVFIVFVIFLSKNMSNPSIQSTYATIGPIKETVSMSGTVTSEEKKIYYAGISAPIGEVSYTKGDLVSKGQVIFTYDEEELKKLRLEADIEAEASGYEYQVNTENNEENKTTLATAESNIKKYKSLVSQKEKEIEELENSLSAEVKAQKKELEEKIAQGNADISGWEFNINSGLLSQDALLTFKGYINSKNIEISEWTKKLSDLNDYTSADGKEDRIKQAKKDLADYQENLTKAESKKASAEAGVLSDTQEKQLEANSELSQLKLEKNQEELAQAEEGIKAEFNGVISNMELVPGQMVAPGTELLRLLSLDKLKVDFYANRNVLTKLEIGQPVTFKILNNTYEGTITKIDHMADSTEQASMIHAEAHIDNPDDKIIIGIDSKMEILTASKEAVLLVPVMAVNTDIKGDFCYVVKDGVAKKVYVTIGVSNYDYCEITEGLSEGDEVITRIPDYEINEMPVVTSVTLMELKTDEDANE